MLALVTTKLAPKVIAKLPSSRLIVRCLASKGTRDHIVVALGGNALLKREEDMTQENQQRNIRQGVASLSRIVKEYNVTLVHGNGPQVGLLVLQGAALKKEDGVQPMKLDVLDAETEGMVGYLVEQELQSHIPPGQGMATLLSQVVVDLNDPAFQNPTKFIGPVMTKEEADKSGLPVKPDGKYWRRVVPSPLPVRLVETQMIALKILKENGCLVICAGGGGIPVVIDDDDGKNLRGVEAVIDKDHAASMLGSALAAQGLLILTDVQAVATNFKSKCPKWIRSASPQALKALMADGEFPSGSMGPKIESAIEFVESTGGWSAIGSLNEADMILRGEAGTMIRPGTADDDIEYYKDIELLLG
jgi:carbamate kinase